MDFLEYSVNIKEDYAGVKFCQDWQVAGYKRAVTGNDAIMGGLGQLLAAALTGRG